MIHTEHMTESLTETLTVKAQSQGDSGSLGASRVRESFNPSKDSMVDKLKRYTADLIDLCEDLKHLDPRLAALAQTYYETAAMYAVKLATTETKP